MILSIVICPATRAALLVVNKHNTPCKHTILFCMLGVLRVLAFRQYICHCIQLPNLALVTGEFVLITPHESTSVPLPGLEPWT